MRDGDRRAPLLEPRQRRLDEPLADGVERGRGLVEDEDPRVLEEHARDRHALLLAARELVAALPHHGLVPLGQLADPIVDGSRLAAASISSIVASGLA